jgi:hypothetical protein
MTLAASWHPRIPGPVANRNDSESPKPGSALEDGLAAYCAGSTAVTPPSAFTCSVQELPIANCWNSVSLRGS